MVAKTRYLYVLIIIFVSYLAAGNNPLWAQEYQKPLETFSTDKIQIIEGISYCHGGYGYQKTAIRINGEYYHKDSNISPYIPTIQPLYITFLSFGCSFNPFFVDYYIIDDSLKLPKIVNVNGIDYNSIEFQVSSLSTGYTFSLIPHYLYLDIGVSYMQYNYKFGMYGDNRYQEYESQDVNVRNYYSLGSLKWFINPFIYIKWQNQLSMYQDNLINSTNQVGINLFSKF
ncbi:MAG: hypothetical protein OEY59_00700 [Deltaproteobacteria bacterium]|nr:hypothetical protein [Deltaproteobacteria bacterium]